MSVDLRMRWREAFMGWRGLRIGQYAISGRGHLRPEWRLGWLVKVMWRPWPFNWFLFYIGPKYYLRRLEEREG